MKAYFCYLGASIWKKPSIWITFGIFWLYTAVLLLIVPAIAKISPLVIWGSSYVSLQFLYVIVLSAVSALLVVFIFREGIETETELIVLSKPIKRFKISICKLLWTIIGVGIICLVASIIALFTLCFGRYDLVTNPQGMKFDKLPALIGSIWLASYVISFVFDGIGIVLSNYLRHLQIIIVLVATSIIISAYSVIVRSIIPTTEKKIVDKTGGDIESRIVTDGHGHTTTYAFMKSTPAADLYDVYYHQKGTGTQVAQYFNFCNQFESLYSTFDLNNQDEDMAANSFGQVAKFNTTISSQEDNLLNDLVNCYFSGYQHDFTYHNHLIPAIPYVNRIYHYDSKTKYEPSDLIDTHRSGFLFLGLYNQSYPAYSLVGAKPDTIFIIDRYQTLFNLPSVYLSPNDLIPPKNSTEFDGDVLDNLLIPLWQQPVADVWLPRHTSEREDGRDLLDNYLAKTWTFLTNTTDNRISKYGISISSEQDVNTAIGMVEYAAIKDYSWLYWTQIVPQYITNNIGDPTNIDNWNIFFENGQTERSYYDLSNKITHFQEIITMSLPTIKDDHGNTINLNADFTVANFIQDALAYNGANNFHDGGGERYASLDIVESHNTYNDSSAYVQYDPNTKSVQFNWDEYKTKDDQGYGYRGPYTALLFNRLETQPNDFLGIKSVYRYTTSPYVNPTGSAITWILISILLYSISFVIYHRLDVK